MFEVMLDLETLSTQQGAAILAIGAVAFRLDDAYPFFNAFEMKTRLGKYNAQVDDDTFRWWMRQSDEARAALGVAEDAFTVELPHALERFASWLRTLETTERTMTGFSPELETGDSFHIWSNGEDFDIPILAAAYERVREDKPWKRKHACDTRTLYRMAGLSQDDLKVLVAEVPGDKHTALGDAKWQARCVQKAWARIAIGLVETGIIAQ